MLSNHVLYSSDGGSHSGMFCGASFVLERMMIDQDVNAFVAVRYVSRNRPQFFTKKVSSRMSLFLLRCESESSFTDNCFEITNLCPVTLPLCFLLIAA